MRGELLFTLTLVRCSTVPQDPHRETDKAQVRQVDSEIH